MIISERFQKQVNAHLLGNMLQIKNYPLILGIFGRPGMGKTYQLREHLKAIGVDVFSVSSADLESERAGFPAKLLKEKYVYASMNVAKNIPSALVIDDIDTTVGEWEQNTGTVNHQGILAFLMHIADNPCYIEDKGDVNRVPVFFTGNNFELLYEPLRRPGRILKFDWEPTRDEKIDIICSYLAPITDEKNIAENLINMYPEQSVSFFMNFFSIRSVEVLSKLACNAVLKQILTNIDYKNELYQSYINNYKNIDWNKEIKDKEEEKVDEAKN